MRRRTVVLVGLAALAALAVAVVASTAFLRGRLEESETLRTSVEQAASAQLGVELSCRGLRIGLWPVELRIEEPVVALPGEARLALSGVSARVDPGSLIEGAARIRSLRVEGPARLASEGLTLEGALKLRLRPEPGGWRVEGEAWLQEGGRAVIRGTIGAAGRFEGEVRLEGVEGAPFAALLHGAGGEQAVLAGRFDGRLEPPGPGRRAVLRLSSEDARIRVPPVRLEGPVALVAEIPRASSAGEDGPGLDSPARFAIDATDARVEYAGGLTRASGRGASVEGKIVRDESGELRLEEVALRVVGLRGERGR